ncbi:MAG: ribosome recycling factor [Ruminococcaceae bacterium]|nr:ribosome recycling factor [Oscillospiraceae bacterium]
MFEELKNKMDKAINALEHDYSAIRAGRANPAILDKVTVDYYGAQTPVAQVGTVSVPEARTLVIQPWDATILHELEKAILKSDIGITPNNDGKVIRLTFPPLTEERRKELVKGISKRAEEAKVTLRGIRRDELEKMKASKKAGEITEDDLKGYEKDIQNITDGYVKDVDTISAKKEKEIMEV